MRLMSRAPPERPSPSAPYLRLRTCRNASSISRPSGAHHSPSPEDSCSVTLRTMYTGRGDEALALTPRARRRRGNSQPFAIDVQGAFTPRNRPRDRETARTSCHSRVRPHRAPSQVPVPCRCRKKGQRGLWSGRGPKGRRCRPIHIPVVPDAAHARSR
ncbi:hypothetical protein GSI_05104 [Ganoderma sinense ZZ0214-1]|uniref:Uncharacterized protein n=1 Tax=Ganoderma sinense ZZ0214-1 TaxID=1077348 RepID=A0A2G8SGV3_9APHY|nr:hypothetical protein GSI_05104 [Ganoderma sinense ZZ0214-1]